jgi:hypothetical protein
VTRNLPGLLVLAATILAVPATSAAKDFSGTVDPYGQLQTWVTIYEQMEETDELYQFPSGDPAAQVVSGFSLARVRAGVRIGLLDDLIAMVVSMRLERGPAVLDAYGAVHVHDALSIVVGQQKIPGPWENLVATKDLDFILRPIISENISDFSLSRTTYASSLFFGIHSYLRDLGIAVSGDVKTGPGRIRYKLMLGNGLGANKFIGGGTGKEYIISNAGQFFLGARVEAADFFGVVTLGGHFTWNRHDDMVFNSGRTVYDLNRMTWSGDLRISIPTTGIRIGGLYGGGVIDDDYDDDGRTDVKFSGWEARLMFRLNDPISAARGSAFLPDHLIEVGARFEQYIYEWNESGSSIIESVWTIGASWSFRSYVGLKLNYMIRKTEDPSLWDLDDDALILQVQFAI